MKSNVETFGLGLGTMRLLHHVAHCAGVIREFIAPSYHPERHYMRGPGPACARRRSSLPSAAA